MSLKDILVYVEDNEQEAATVAAACTLARQHDAHLTGLAVDRPPEIPGFATIEIPPSAVEIIKAQRKESLERARRTFDETVNKAGLADRSGWSVSKGRQLESLVLRSRYADITVVSQNTPEDEGGDALIDDFILASGRPALVIPYIGAPETFGRNILIAWNASREAARAVSDAMPLLETADKIEVFAVEPNGMGDLPGADIASHLSRHGLNVSTAKTAGLDIDVGDVLLNQVADGGADMVVMGAYGHSRMRELVLGGATRHILKHMTVPVLLSH